MKRRTFLGAGAAAAAAASSACGTTLVGNANLDLDRPEDAFGSRLDRAHERITANSVPVSARAGDSMPLWDQDGKARVGRVLATVSAARDLTPAQRTHPDVQAKLWAAVPEMDEVIYGTMATLQGISLSREAEFRAALRNPDFEARAVHRLSKQAYGAETSLAGQARLRRLATHATWRLKNQPLSAIVGEFQGKLQRLSMHRHELHAVYRGLREKIGEEAFWRHHERMLALGPAAMPPDGGGASALPPVTAPNTVKYGAVYTATGAILLGTGLALGVLPGAILLALAGSVGFLGVTAGGVLLSLGLFHAIWGAVFLGHD